MSEELAVTVTAEELSAVVEVGSVTILSGLLPDGRRVRFAGDRRAVSVILEAVEAAGPVVAAVPGWAVLGSPEAVMPLGD